MKTGSVILIVGRQGSGKTPVARRLAMDSNFKNRVVLDVNKEYDSDEFTVFYNFENYRRFLNIARNSFLITEEATIFLSGQKEADIAQSVVRIQHANNVLVFLFHSLMDAPPYLLRLAEFMILLPTNDDPEIIKRQRPKFFQYLNSSEDVYINLSKL